MHPNRHGVHSQLFDYKPCRLSIGPSGARSVPIPGNEPGYRMVPYPGPARDAGLAQIIRVLGGLCEVRITPPKSDLSGVHITPRKSDLSGVHITPRKNELCGVHITPRKNELCGVHITPRKNELCGVHITLRRSELCGAHVTPPRSEICEAHLISAYHLLHEIQDLAPAWIGGGPVVSMKPGGPPRTLPGPSLRREPPLPPQPAPPFCRCFYRRRPSG